MMNTILLNRPILVTGASGYIGSHTVLALLQQGYNIVAYDNFCNSSPAALDMVSKLAKRSLDIVKGDIRDQTRLDDVFKQYNPSAVIHFAGLKAVGQSQTIPLDYYHQNLSGSNIVFSLMEKYGCSNLVFSSSATVYGDAHYLPYDEAHPLQPKNPYGRTKYFIEEMIKDWSASYGELSAIMLRYFNPVGAHASGLIGENPNDEPNNLFPMIAQVATGQRDTLSVFGHDYETHDGSGERDYIHVEDLAAAHIAALDYANKIRGCDVFNIGTGKGASVLDVIKAYEKASGTMIKYELCNRRKGDVATSVADASKAKRVLNWTAKRELDEMCISSWRFQSQNSSG